VSIPRILVIAGSDSGGGAGIQADIKTITMLGGHAMTAITAITAQNTLGVSGVHAVPVEMVLAQIDAVVSDIGVDAVKIGMIGSAAIMEAVAGRLEGMGDVPVVLDPVMAATSGAALADAETIAGFDRLLARATVVTPNAPELAALTGRRVEGEQAMVAAARMLAERHGCAVVAKGGHLSGSHVVDLLVEPAGVTARWQDDWIETRHTHGTGCTLASGIATGLAAGMPLADAVARARGFVRAALEAAPGLGGGHGPMGHGLVDAGS
jgi:hydroxymethylpyrimidine/phosphomethylpyrimidine kinase